MTIEEMIKDFTEQQSKVRSEVAEPKEALGSKTRSCAFKALSKVSAWQRKK